MNAIEIKQRNLRLIPFVLAVLCFFMPFIGGDNLSVSGIQCAMGFNMHSEEKQSMNELNSLIGGRRVSEIDHVPGDPGLLLAVICGGLGVVLNLGMNKRLKLFAAVAGGVGLACMIRTKLMGDNESAKEGGGPQFQTGFYLVALFFLAGAVIAWQQYQQDKRTGALVAPPSGEPPQAADACPGTKETSGGALAGSGTPALKYYYSGAGAEVKGPFVDSELSFLEKNGIINGETHVILEGGSEWITWDRIKAGKLQ